MMEKAMRTMKQINLRTILRWAGPAGIGFGVFLVFSAMSGMPINIPFVTAPNDGFELVGSGLVLFALVMLLVGMVGLYARESEPGAAKVIREEEWSKLEEAADLDEELEELLEAEAAETP